MSTTDARTHTVPAAGDRPARRAFDDLSLSIRDAIPVANATARSQKLAQLAALTPSITPSTANPIEFFRADAPAGQEYEYTTNGVDFWTRPGLRAGRYSATARRGGPDEFSPTQQATAANVVLPTTAPAGLYLVTYKVTMTCTQTSIGYLRGLWGTASVTEDDPMTVDSSFRSQSTTVTVVHGGGQVNVAAVALIAAGKATVQAGSRVTVAWQGPA